MSQLVNEIFSALELLLQGSFACLLAWYAVTLYHPLPHILFRYAISLWRPIAANVEDPKVRTTYVVALALATLYAWGVLSNAFNYWLLHPVQNEIIASVRARQQAFGTSPLTDAVHTARLIWFRNESVASYDAYIEDDARWRNLNLSAHSSILPGLRKFIRILRGALISSYILIGIALLKICVSAVALLVMGNARKNRTSVMMYIYFVSLKAFRRRHEPLGVHPLARRVRRDLLYPNIALLLFGAGLLLSSVVSYRAAEMEYQTLVWQGALSAAPATTDTASK